MRRAVSTGIGIQAAVCAGEALICLRLGAAALRAHSGLTAAAHSVSDTTAGGARQPEVGGGRKPGCARVRTARRSRRHGTTRGRSPIRPLMGSTTRLSTRAATHGPGNACTHRARRALVLPISWLGMARCSLSSTRDTATASRSCWSGIATPDTPRSSSTTYGATDQSRSAFHPSARPTRFTTRSGTRHDLGRRPQTRARRRLHAVAFRARRRPCRVPSLGLRLACSAGCRRSRHISGRPPVRSAQPRRPPIR